jgi:glycosyltransferase involved in cell wall biosynthesis
MPPLVSVVIPCKNDATWLGEAIESCLGQTWKHLEIIVVDNCSTDASMEVAGRYRSSSVVLLECARSGASAARNVGLARARGEFVQFLDADDLLDRDKIRLQMARLDAGPRSSVASGAWGRFRQTSSEAAFVAEPVWRDLAPEEFLISSWMGGGMMPVFAWLTPRDAIERAGPWNERLSLCDDGEYFARVALASSGILFCDGARGYYRASADQTLSKRRDRIALASGFEAIELSCQGLLKRCNSAAATKACASYYQGFAFDAYPEVPDLVAEAERRACQLGGSDLEIHGGPAFELISNCFGWKFAKLCQSAWWKSRGFAARKAR